MWNLFVEAVTQDFGFLESQFGFALKSTTSPNVIYESDVLQIQIYYDVDRRHELDLRFRRLSDAGHKHLSLGIGILMRLKDGLDTPGYPSPFPSSADVLLTEVNRLANLVQKYGSDILKGDFRDFELMKELEQELANKFGPQ